MWLCVASFHRKGLDSFQTFNQIVHHLICRRPSPIRFISMAPDPVSVHSSAVVLLALLGGLLVGANGQDTSDATYPTSLLKGNEASKR
jgi:hypothetical protein